MSASAAVAHGWGRGSTTDGRRPQRAIALVDVRPLHTVDAGLRDLATHTFAVRVRISGWTLLPYRPGATARDNRRGAGHWRLYLDGRALGDNFGGSRLTYVYIPPGTHWLAAELSNADATSLRPAVWSEPVILRVPRVLRCWQTGWRSAPRTGAPEYACNPRARPGGADPGARATAANEPDALARARLIGAEVAARYGMVPGGGLAVSETTSTGVIESFTLLSSDLLETRVVPADNGLYFAICPLRAACPYPDRRFARPAADFLPRRLALELAVRTFLETSATVVAVSLPTPRFILFVVERQELARDVDMQALAKALAGDAAHAFAPSLRQNVEKLTRPRIFVALGLEPTSSGRDTLEALPRWPTTAGGRR